ncbi:MAG: HD domain-containing protein [archaeon]|nr:HD domain-containing protein [archaeon]
MKEIIEEIRKKVFDECSNKEFIHHSWYWQHHIIPMLKISLELADKLGIDKELIELIVYLHDIAKIRGLDNHAEEGAKIASEMLQDIQEKKLILECIAKHNKPSENDSVEVKLIASADAVSHFLSPFFEIYLWENPDKPFDELCTSNIRKAEKDWKRILLPEAQEMAREEYENVKKRYEVEQKWQ